MVEHVTVPRSHRSSAFADKFGYLCELLKHKEAELNKNIETGNSLKIFGSTWIFVMNF